MSDINLYSVNWQDGMLINQKHLKDQERFLEELVRWHSLHVGDNFGLVVKSFDAKPPLSMSMHRNGRSLTVEIQRCQALTSDGYYIETSEGSYGILKAVYDCEDGVIPVYISTDALHKKQVGSPDPSEPVPRVPFLVSNNTLYMGEKPNVAEGKFLKIAELIVSGSEVKHNEKYYPPCLSIFADSRLSQKAVEYKNRLEKLILLSSQAYTAMAEDSGSLNEKTGLQEAFKDTMGHFLQHLSSTLDLFVTGRNSMHPLTMFLFFKRLFRVFSTFMNLHPGLRDYINEKYFMVETKSNISHYMSAIDNFLLSEYDHNNIGIHITEIDNLFDPLRNIIGFFAQVEKGELGSQAMASQTLTYLGKTYNIAEYGSCRLETVGELNYLKAEFSESKPMSDITILMEKNLFDASTWSNIQVRLGLNEARGLGDTDPINIDTTTFGNKVSLRPQDLMQTPRVSQITLIFRGVAQADKLSQLGKTDFIIYTM